MSAVAPQPLSFHPFPLANAQFIWVGRNGTQRTTIVYKNGMVNFHFPELKQMVERVQEVLKSHPALKARFVEFKEIYLDGAIAFTFANKGDAYRFQTFIAPSLFPKDDYFISYEGIYTTNQAQRATLLRMDGQPFCLDNILSSFRDTTFHPELEPQKGAPLPQDLSEFDIYEDKVTKPGPGGKPLPSSLEEALSAIQ